jgi:ubiquinone/menaquinone biosynthesis C-methylase UbiE
MLGFSQIQCSSASQTEKIMSDTAVSMQRIKDSMRAAWEAGDFGMVAKMNASNGETFVNRLPISPRSRVLDVATGTGNLAIPLARAGAVVTGVDIATNLLAQARERAASENLAVTFEEGDAEQLPYDDGAFDVVVSMFGAMFAPRPELVASELARVLKRDGLLAMANWSPASFSGQMFRVTSQHVPPPPGIAPPVLWGDEATVTQRLAPYFTDIKTEPVPMDFKLPTNPAGAVAFFRKYFGPTQAAFNRLDEAGKTALAADLESLWSSANTAQDPATQTFVHNEYLFVSARRR